MSADETMDLGSPSRLERLEESVWRIRLRRLGTERTQLLVGAVLGVLGFGVILIGWFGASRTPFVFEQIPYVISGGLLGLAMVLVGSFVYFAYWVAKLISDSREQAARTEQALQRIEALLSEGPATNGSKTASGSKGVQEVFLATPAGTMFHRHDCPVVAGRKGLRRVSAGAPGMEPCSVCDPLAQA